MLKPPRQSFFLFGPRGVGKTAWLHRQSPHGLFFDLLDYQVYTELLAAPQRLGEQIRRCHKDWVVVDEVQRVPELLDEVHRLIESRRSVGDTVFTTCACDQRLPGLGLSPALLAHEHG